MKGLLTKQGAPVDAMYPGEVINQAFNGDAASTDALGTDLVRLISDQDCYILIGEEPVVTATTGTKLIADLAEKFACKPTDKISVIRVAADGNLNITKAV